MVEALAHALLDRVLQVDHAHHLRVARDRERRAALTADPVECRLELCRGLTAVGGDERDDRVAGALAQLTAVEAIVGDHPLGVFMGCERG